MVPDSYVRVSRMLVRPMRKVDPLRMLWVLPLYSFIL